MMQSEISDKELWVQMNRGDMKSTETLYLSYYDMLFRYGIKYCGDADLVMDCIQDLFLKLHGRRSPKQVVYIKPYLLNSLQHLIYDRLAKSRRTEDLDDHMFVFGEDEAVDETLVRSVYTECNALPPRTRQALYLRYVTGMSYREISEAMEINVQSCMNLVNRAMTRLRSIIK